MMETALQIIDREIRGGEKRRRAEIKKTREHGARLVIEANEAEARLEKQLDCNAAGKHRFVDGGGGMLGDRFQEKCKLCGWIYDV